MTKGNKSNSKRNENKSGQQKNLHSSQKNVTKKRASADQIHEVNNNGKLTKTKAHDTIADLEDKYDFQHHQQLDDIMPLIDQMKISEVVDDATLQIKATKSFITTTNNNEHQIASKKDQKKHRKLKHSTKQGKQQNLLSVQRKKSFFQITSAAQQLDGNASQSSQMVAESGVQKVPQSAQQQTKQAGVQRKVAVSDFNKIATIQPGSKKKEISSISPLKQQKHYESGRENTSQGLISSKSVANTSASLQKFNRQDNNTQNQLMTESQRNKRLGQLNFLKCDNNSKVTFHQNNRIVNFLNKETSIIAKTEKVEQRRQSKRLITSEQSGTRSPFHQKQRLIKKIVAPSKDEQMVSIGDLMQKGQPNELTSQVEQLQSLLTGLKSPTSNCQQQNLFPSNGTKDIVIAADPYDICIKPENDKSFVQRTPRVVPHSKKSVFLQNVKGYVKGFGMQSVQNLKTPQSSRKAAVIGTMPIIDACSMSGSQSQSMATFGSDAKIAHSVLIQHQMRQMSLKKENEPTPSSSAKKSNENNVLKAAPFQTAFQTEASNQDKVFKSFVDLYSKQIQEATTNIPVEQQSSTRPLDKRPQSTHRGKQAQQLQNSLIIMPSQQQQLPLFSPLSQHSSKLQTKDHHPPKQSNESALYSSERFFQSYHQRQIAELESHHTGSTSNLNSQSQNTNQQQNQQRMRTSAGYKIRSSRKHLYIQSNNVVNTVAKVAAAGNKQQILLNEESEQYQNINKGSNGSPRKLIKTDKNHLFTFNKNTQKQSFVNSSEQLSDAIVVTPIKQLSSSPKKPSILIDEIEGKIIGREVVSDIIMDEESAHKPKTKTNDKVVEQSPQWQPNGNDTLPRMLSLKVLSIANANKGVSFYNPIKINSHSRSPINANFVQDQIDSINFAGQHHLLHKNFKSSSTRQLKNRYRNHQHSILLSKQFEEKAQTQQPEVTNQDEKIGDDDEEIVILEQPKKLQKSTTTTGANFGLDSAFSCQQKKNLIAVQRPKTASVQNLTHHKTTLKSQQHTVALYGGANQQPRSGMLSLGSNFRPNNKANQPLLAIQQVSKVQLTSQHNSSSQLSVNVVDNSSKMPVSFQIKGDSIKVPNGTNTGSTSSDAYQIFNTHLQANDENFDMMKETHNKVASEITTMQQQPASLKQFKISQNKQTISAGVTTSQNRFNNPSTGSNKQHRYLSAKRGNKPLPISSRRPQFKLANDHQQQQQDKERDISAPLTTYLDVPANLNDQNITSTQQQKDKDKVNKSQSNEFLQLNKHSSIASSGSGVRKSGGRLFGQNQFTTHEDCTPPQYMTPILTQQHSSLKNLQLLPTLPKSITTISTLTAPPQAPQQQIALQVVKMPLPDLQPIITLPRWTSNTNTNSTAANQQAPNSIGGPNVNLDDSQSLKIMVDLVRSVHSRVEDLHQIKQAMDVKLRKTRHANIDFFEELKAKEITRLARENVLFQGLLGLKQTQSTMTRRQLIKHCKKIYKVFWNIIDAEEEAQEYSQMQRHPGMFLFSELNLIEVLAEKGEKMQVFKRSIAIQAKIFEAIFREKDLELNFCVALGLQKARQTFFAEFTRATNILQEFLDQAPEKLALLRKIVKGLTDAQSQRRLKLVTLNTKTDKMLNHLTQMNQEVSEHRLSYLTGDPAKVVPLIQSQQQLAALKPVPKRSGPLLQQNVAIPPTSANRSLRNANLNKTTETNGKTNLASRNINSTQQQNSKKQYLISLKKTKTEETLKTVQNQKTYNSKKTFKSLISGSVDKIIDKRTDEAKLAKKIVGIRLRKYKWQYLYSQETKIGLNKSSKLKNQTYYIIGKNSYVPSLPEILAKDLENSLDQKLYNHYSMKKGNEHHLTLILETRALKLQKMARNFHRVRVRAANTIQKRLKALYQVKNSKRIKKTDHLTVMQSATEEISEIENNNEQQGSSCLISIAEIDKENDTKNYKAFLPQIVFLQQALKRFMAKDKYSKYRLDQLYEAKYEQQSCIMAQYNFQKNLIGRVRDEILSTAKLDCKALEIQHGITLHQGIAEKVSVSNNNSTKISSKKNVQSVVGENDEIIDAEKWKEFWRHKLNEDFLQRLHQCKVENKMESAAIRRQIFMRRFNDGKIN